MWASPHLGRSVLREQQFLVSQLATRARLPPLSPPCARKAVRAEVHRHQPVGRRHFEHASGRAPVQREDVHRIAGIAAWLTRDVEAGRCDECVIAEPAKDAVLLKLPSLGYPRGLGTDRFSGESPTGAFPSPSPEKMRQQWGWPRTEQRVGAGAGYNDHCEEAEDVARGTASHPTDPAGKGATRSRVRSHLPEALPLTRRCRGRAPEPCDRHAYRRRARQTCCPPSNKRHRPS